MSNFKSSDEQKIYEGDNTHITIFFHKKCSFWLITQVQFNDGGASLDEKSTHI